MYERKQDSSEWKVSGDETMRQASEKMSSKKKKRYTWTWRTSQIKESLVFLPNLKLISQLPNTFFIGLWFLATEIIYGNLFYVFWLIRVKEVEWNWELTFLNSHFIKGTTFMFFLKQVRWISSEYKAECEPGCLMKVYHTSGHILSTFLSDISWGSVSPLSSVQ